MKVILYNKFCSELEGHWKELEACSQHHIFQSYGWLKHWQETIGYNLDCITPVIAVVLDDSERPKIIFPLGVRRLFSIKILEFLGGRQADYSGPLIHEEWMSAKDRLEAAWHSTSEILPKYDIIHFKNLPSVWRILENPFIKIWKPRLQSISYSAELPDDFNDYLLSLKSKFRSDTRRRRKLLSKEGLVTFEVIEADDNQWDVVVDTLIHQKRQRYFMTGVPDRLSDKYVQTFYKGLPKLLPNNGRLHLSVLKLHETILATHWGGVYGDRYYHLMPTFLGGKWTKFSAGRLLLEGLIEWCIVKRIKLFDFTVGSEEYKKDWCNREMPLFEYINMKTVSSVPYYIYIRLRHYAEVNPKIWKLIKIIYSAINFRRKTPDI